MRSRTLGLQLRPLEVADRAGAIGALGGGLGHRQLRQHVVAQPRDFQLRHPIAPVRVDQGRIQRDVPGLAFDLERRDLGFGCVDRGLRATARAQRHRDAGDQADIAAGLQATQAQRPVEIGTDCAARELQARLANALLAGELLQFRRAIQQCRKRLHIADARKAQGIAACHIECRCTLAPQRRQVLTRGRVALDGTRAIQLGACKRGLRGQHHRFRRCTRLQALSRAGHGAPALGDVAIGDLTLAACAGHGEMTPRGVREQVEPARFALHRERIDATFGEHATRVQLAAAFEHGGQAQGQLGALQATDLAAAEHVFELCTDGPCRPQQRLVALGQQHLLARAQQAQVGMAFGDARECIVKGEDRRGIRYRLRTHLQARHQRQDGQSRQSQPHGEFSERVKTVGAEPSARGVKP